MQLQLAVSNRDALECILEDRSFLVPAAAITRVIECEIVALPLARQTIAGIGVHERSVLLALRPFAGAQQEPRRRVTLALLEHSHPRCRVGLEVERVGSIVRVPRLGARVGPWALDAQTEDGRSLPWLLVEEMLQELGAGAAT